MFKRGSQVESSLVARGNWGWRESTVYESAQFKALVDGEGAGGDEDGGAFVVVDRDLQHPEAPGFVRPGQPLSADTLLSLAEFEAAFFAPLEARTLQNKVDAGSRWHCAHVPGPLAQGFCFGASETGLGLEEQQPALASAPSSGGGVSRVKFCIVGIRVGSSLSRDIVCSSSASHRGNGSGLLSLFSWAISAHKHDVPSWQKPQESKVAGPVESSVLSKLVLSESRPVENCVVKSISISSKSDLSFSNIDDSLVDVSISAGEPVTCRTSVMHLQ